MDMKYTRKILASYNQETLRVYQAYNPVIAAEAVKLKNFGEHFSRERMTWIKPSFLWMMYRSNWGSKKDQERILAIDVRRNVFETLLGTAVLTSPERDYYSDRTQWEKQFKAANVYCQWDPDKDIYGRPINRAAIQIGLKREALEYFLSEGISDITDISVSVAKWKEQKNSGRLDKKSLPEERVYPIGDPEICRRLSISVD